MAGMLGSWREKTKALKRDITAIGIAARDRRTPWIARLLVVAIIAYALSPIDLIPDFIPVLGYLDDLVLLPAALVLALRLIPPEVMAEARAKAEGQRLGASMAAAAVIVALWLAAVAWALPFIWPLFSR